MAGAATRGVSPPASLGCRCVGVASRVSRGIPQVPCTLGSSVSYEGPEVPCQDLKVPWKCPQVSYVDQQGAAVAW